MQRPTLWRLVNQLSIYREVLAWYLERRRDGASVSPNTDLNISQGLVTTTFRTQKQFSRIQGLGTGFSRSRILEACRSGATIRDPTSDFT